jgi:hypothetical protein
MRLFGNGTFSEGTNPKAKFGEACYLAKELDFYPNRKK